MDFGDGGSAGGSSGGADMNQGSPGSEGLKRKWSDLEASMKAVKDALVQENAEKSAKIRRLMEDTILLEETVLRLEKPSSFRGSVRPMPRSNPFVVLPAEVWEMIIGKMSRASDLEILCLAFPQLEPLVKKTNKTLFLFEKVLPFVCEHLNSKDINNCRIVCEKWNRDLCALLANWNAPNLLSETSKAPDADYPPPCIPLQNAYDFGTHRRIQKFLQKMADYPGNPFFGRFLRLAVYDRTDLEQFWESALELVKKFGEHVWNLEIFCYRGRADPIAFYKALQETLIYLPNLRNFTVIVDSNFCDHGSSKTGLAAQIGSSPLPPLAYLQSLVLLHEADTGMMSAFSSLFTQGVQRLELLGEAFGNMDLKAERLRGLINVEHLEVGFQSTEDLLKLLQFPSPKLRKLCVISRPVASVTSEQVGNLLERFNGLEYLDLIFCPVESYPPLSSEMRFPSLKTLKMSVRVEEDDFNHNLDFILWFRSLKHLEIYKIHTDKTILNVDEMDTYSTLKIRSCMHTGQMLDSNIWTLIPSLELLEITGWAQGKFTREMFENQRG